MFTKYLSLVKFSHTIFALPFALSAYVFALNSNRINFEIHDLVYVILCMVFARNAAMGFNRYLDRDIDAINPRTAGREIPAGIIKSRHALLFVIINSILFIISAGLLNTLCLILSPVALLVILGYSYTKRFTFLCHFILGLGLALAPVGTYIAITGTIQWIPILLGIGVMLWVAGFDIIYASQDTEFDNRNKLFSIPSFFGLEGGLKIARISHLLSSIAILICCTLVVLSYDVSVIFIFSSWVIFSLFLVFQHSLVSSNDLSKVNLAFFTSNGIASIVFFILFSLGLYFKEIQQLF